MLPMAQGYFYCTSRHTFHIRRRCINFCITTTRIHLLLVAKKKKKVETKTPKKTHRSAPAASTTTSSSESVRRPINVPTTFFPCKRRRVDGSLCIKFETATQAHLRSTGSAFSI